MHQRNNFTIIQWETDNKHFSNSIEAINLPATDASVGSMAHAASGVAIVLEKAAKKDSWSLLMHSAAPQDTEESKSCLSTAVLLPILAHYWVPCPDERSSRAPQLCGHLTPHVSAAQVPLNAAPHCNDTLLVELFSLKSIKTCSSLLSMSPSWEGRCAQSTINIGLGVLRAKHISRILLLFLKYVLITIQFPLILNGFKNSFVVILKSFH